MPWPKSPRWCDWRNFWLRFSPLSPDHQSPPDDVTQQNSGCHSLHLILSPDHRSPQIMSLKNIIFSIKPTQLNSTHFTPWTKHTHLTPQPMQPNPTNFTRLHYAQPMTLTLKNLLTGRRQNCPRCIIYYITLHREPNSLTLLLNQCNQTRLTLQDSTTPNQWRKLEKTDSQAADKIVHVV